MLWGHLSVTYARPVTHFSAQASGAPHVRAASPRGGKQAAPVRTPASAVDQGDRRNDDLPNPPPGRRNGHMSPEDRRLLRQHIQDAVRELYSH